MFSSVFGSNLQSDRNVPAGDDFVKIDVNSFPVLTLLKERNSKNISLSHTNTHTQNRWVGKYMKSYSVVLSLSTLLIENYPSGSSNVYFLTLTWVCPRWVYSLSFRTSLDVCTPRRIRKCQPHPLVPPYPSRGRCRQNAPCVTL